MNNKTKTLLAFCVLAATSLACGLFGVSGEATEEIEATSTPQVVVVTATPEMVTETPETEMETEAPEDTTPQATLNQDLNVRYGPGTEYGIITALPGGTTLDVIGIDQYGYWWQVQLPDGTIGWVSISYTTSENTEDVEVVAGPPAPTSSSSEASPTESGGGSVAPSDSDISTTLNIKSGNLSKSGEISYPDGDSVDEVFVQVNGFDSITTSGEAVYFLNCSSTGSPPSITFIGGSVVDGVVACNSSWTVFYTNDSDTSTITIQQESNAYATWQLNASANN
ncbi:SH3 domain-containing protein [bacterium]|nr:SH3 domain-containing protein [bacterium]